MIDCVLGVVQMAAQVKQLEQRLMALREEVREKEAKARLAEGSVQDLKLQLGDLQVSQPGTLPTVMPGHCMSRLCDMGLLVLGLLSLSRLYTCVCGCFAVVDKV